MKLVVFLKVYCGSVQDVDRLEVLPSKLTSKVSILLKPLSLNKIYTASFITLTSVAFFDTKLFRSLLKIYLNHLGSYCGKKNVDYKSDQMYTCCEQELLVMCNKLIVKAVISFSAKMFWSSESFRCKRNCRKKLGFQKTPFMFVWKKRLLKQNRRFLTTKTLLVLTYFNF